MRVLLIAGGWSAERKVSLNGANFIQKALQELGHEVIFLDLAKDFEKLPKVVKKVDFAFINLHGSPGEDGLVQAMLDKFGCPYQGSGPGPSMIALNKVCSKIIFKENEINTPKWEFLPILPEGDWTPKLKFPLVVKPNTGGSSVDIKIVNHKEELNNAIKKILDQNQGVLIEEKIDGMEITCGVLGDRALPPVLIEPGPKCEFFDYYSKYTKGAAKEICPAPIPEDLTNSIMELAIKCHNILGLSGYSRTDFIVRDKEIYVLEVNTLPGMTETSLFPQEAAAIGIDFKSLIKRLIELGLPKS